MASDSTDALFGFILFILFLALLGYAAGGASWPSTSPGATAYPRSTPVYTATPSATDKSNTNLPGGTLEACRGKVVANKTSRSSHGSLNLKIYYTEDNDRNCAEATRHGWPDRTQGRMRVTMRFSDYTGNQWPEYAWAWSQPHTTKLSGVYLDDTYNRCVTATASYETFTGMEGSSVKIGPTGCN
jgi:hypothetical protein